MLWNKKRCDKADFYEEISLLAWLRRIKDLNWIVVIRQDEVGNSPDSVFGWKIFDWTKQQENVSLKTTILRII